MPPARYTDAGTVLDIHTRATENGYAAGFDGWQGTKEGFNNTNAYIKYNHGHHQFSFDYSLELRNAPDCDEQEVYTFKPSKMVTSKLPMTTAAPTTSAMPTTTST